MTIKVMTDSTADIPQELLQRYDIRVLPLTVHFGEESYLDKEELRAEEFFDLLKKNHTLPTTSQVSVGRFMEAFEEEKESDLIVFIGLSDSMSGTLSSAHLAAREFPEEKILVFDSQHVTFALGLLVLAFAQEKEAIHSRSEAIKLLSILRSQLRCWFLVDTLEYLVKGGRLSSLKGKLGQFFRVKPILTIQEGKLGIHRSERGRKNAMRAILEEMKRDFSEGRIDEAALYHAADPTAMEEMKRLIDENFIVRKWLFSEVGSVVATHAGPGCLGVSYLVRNEEAANSLQFTANLIQSRYHQ